MSFESALSNTYHVHSSPQRYFYIVEYTSMNNVSICNSPGARKQFVSEVLFGHDFLTNKIRISSGVQYCYDTRLLSEYPFALVMRYLNLSCGLLIIDAVSYSRVPNFLIKSKLSIEC